MLLLRSRRDRLLRLFDRYRCRDSLVAHFVIGQIVFRLCDVNGRLDPSSGTFAPP